MGTDGLYEISLLNTKAAHYLEKLLLKTGKFERVFDYAFYNEFLMKSKNSVPTVNRKLLQNNFIPPLEISKFYRDEDFKDVLLFAVTEVLNKGDLNKVAEILSE